MTTTPHSSQRRRVVVTPHTRVLRSGDRLLVRRGDAVSVIEGPAGGFVEQLLAAADSEPSGILSLPIATTPEEERVVDQLEALLTESTLTSEAEPEAFAEADQTLRTLWMRSGGEVSLEQLAATRSDAHVLMTGRGPLAARIEAGLAESGVRTSRHTDPGSDLDLARVDFLVCIADHHDDPGLGEVNRDTLTTGTPWLPVLGDDGQRTVVGPLIHPGSSACWECVRLRRAANFPDSNLVSDLGRADGIPAPTTAASTVAGDYIVAGVAVEKILDRVVLGDRASMTRPGAMGVIRPAEPGLRIEEHLVLRVPRCPACSPTAGRGEPQVWFHGGAR